MPRPAAHSEGALPALHIPGETSTLPVHLPRMPREEGGASHHLFVSPHHPASTVLQQKLQQRLPGIKCSADMEACSLMLIVLDAGAHGDAQADSPALNSDAYQHDVLTALKRGVRPALLHVGPTRATEAEANADRAAMRGAASREAVGAVAERLRAEAATQYARGSQGDVAAPSGADASAAAARPQ